MKSIVFKITLAVSILILIAVLMGTYFSGERMTVLFYEYMSDAATANDPFPLIKDGKILAGPAENVFLRAIYSDLAWIGIPITLLASLIGYLIARSVTSPLRKLSLGAQEIAKGNLSQRVDIREGGELGALANSFNAMAGELSKAEELRKQFFADAAHELKTPIAVIKGNIEGMIDGVIPTDKAILASLLEETDFLGNMVSDMKYLAQADAGYLELSKQRTDINELVSSCVSRLMPSATARRLAITKNFKIDPLFAFVDAERIVQIVYNLLINAGKYTPEGGAITVTTEKFVDDEVMSFKIIVADTGIGISEADIPHVFDRFYRTDKSRDRKTGGIGLGLSIVKKLTELHGGRVGVTSKLEKGSSFYIIIPIGGTHA